MKHLWNANTVYIPKLKCSVFLLNVLIWINCTLLFLSFQSFYFQTYGIVATCLILLFLEYCTLGYSEMQLICVPVVLYMYRTVLIKKLLKWGITDRGDSQGYNSQVGEKFWSIVWEQSYFSWVLSLLLFSYYYFYLSWILSEFCDVKTSHSVSILDN